MVLWHNSIRHYNDYCWDYYCIFWLINAGSLGEMVENEKKAEIILLTLTIAFGISLGLIEGIRKLGEILAAIICLIWIIIMVFGIISIFIDNINWKSENVKMRKKEDNKKIRKVDNT